jgi:hypothetical protein
MNMEQSVPKRRHTKFRRRGITQKKTYNYPKKLISGLSESCESLALHFWLGRFEPWIWRHYGASKRRIRTTQWSGVILQKIGNLPKCHWLEIYTNLNACHSYICMWKRQLLLLWNQACLGFGNEKMWDKALSWARVPRHMGTMVFLFHVFFPIIRILKVVMYVHIYICTYIYIYIYIYVFKNESIYYRFREAEKDFLLHTRPLLEPILIQTCLIKSWRFIFLNPL